MGNLRDNKGFTLVEILIVLSISALLSGLAIVYTHIGQNQITLSIEESKIAQLILEAKQLSVATYSSNNNTCAYGMQFNYTDQTYSLFAYNAAVSSPSAPGRPICPSVASTTAGINAGAVAKYADGSWNIHVSSGVKIIDAGAASTTIYYVLFYPPNPFTLMSFDGSTFLGAYTNPIAPTGNIYLETSDGGTARTITVNSAGQVNLL